MAGRPPKPTALKILNGSAAHHPERANLAEPMPDALTAIPEPPMALRGHARLAWNRLAREAIAMHVLTSADLDALAMGCLAFADFMSARRVATQWRRADAAWKRYISALRSFGMDPSSRTRLHATPQTAVDPFEQFLARKASG
jgi:phage terminase small subunit